MPATQVIKAPAQTMSVDDVQNMSRVDDYKSLITQIRGLRASLVLQMQGLMTDIQNMTEAHQHLLDQFKANAMQMAPQYQGQDLKSVILSLPQTDPLYQLWLSASQTINDVRNAIASKTMQLDQLNTQEQANEAQETQTVASYKDFSSTATTPVPSVDQLLANITAVSAIPQAQEQTVVASLPAIEELSSEAASAVTLQIVQAQGAQPVDLAMSVQSTNTDPGIIAPGAAPTIVPFRQLHPAIFYGGLAALFWIFGGKKSSGSAT